MLDVEVIRFLQSLYFFNIVLVRKKDGSFCFCIDYRKFNLRIIKDVYNFFRIDDIIDRFVGLKYFLKLDLISFYWQVELEEEDKEKIVFLVSGIGYFECNRMGFGFINVLVIF